VQNHNKTPKTPSNNRENDEQPPTAWLHGIEKLNHSLTASPHNHPRTYCIELKNGITAGIHPTNPANCLPHTSSLFLCKITTKPRKHPRTIVKMTKPNEKHLAPDQPNASDRFVQNHNKTAFFRLNNRENDETDRKKVSICSQKSGHG
jgi:hypothetical protein